MGLIGRTIGDREPSKALPYLRRALDIREKTLPAESPVLADALTDVGQAYLDLKQPCAAMSFLERAEQVLESNKRDLVFLARSQFHLARALWDSHSDRERAIDLAQRARSTLVKTGKTKIKLLKDVQGWLSSRPKAQASL